MEAGCACGAIFLVKGSVCFIGKKFRSNPVCDDGAEGDKEKRWPGSEKWFAALKSLFKKEKDTRRDYTVAKSDYV